MPNVNELRKEIIDWTNAFPLDRWYRQKHNIALFSKEHREVCQIAVYEKWLEDQNEIQKQTESIEKIIETFLVDLTAYLTETLKEGLKGKTIETSIGTITFPS